VTARFSDGSGMPSVPDGSPAMPRGIAIKYHLPSGPATDMVTNSFKFFPVGTGEDFRDLLQAIVASPPDAPKPTKLEQFFASHPNAPKAIGSLPIPDSFADEEYHGIDAFIFVNKSGQRQAVRYLVVPEKLVHITPEEAAKQSPDYLFDDLAKRIARKPLVFHLKAQLAEPGDQTKDASLPWPDDRKLVDLGVLTLTKVVPGRHRRSCCFCRRISLPVSSSPTIRCRACALPPMGSRLGGAASRRPAEARTKP
jgi:catalase